VRAVLCGVLSGVVPAAASAAIAWARYVAAEETVAAADGYPLWIRYYAAPAQHGPPMYLVAGVALGGRLYVMVGSTSSAPRDYRQQAALFRASMVSFRGR